MALFYFFIFFKMGQPWPLFRFYFRSFHTNTTTILQQIYVKKCPSSIRCRDSNPRPSEHESPPITTRPRLRPTASMPRTSYKLCEEE